MKLTARSMAYNILQQVFEEDAYTNLALKQAFAGMDQQNDKLGERDRALCTEIVYGTVQRLRTIDLFIRPFSKRKLSDLNIPVLTILRMTIYQLAFLDKIPGYAAIHEAVELAKVHEPKASGFVNGVLRSFVRSGKDTRNRIEELEKQAHSWAEKAGIRYSFPTWLVKKFEAQYGRSRTESILNSSNQRSHLSVRANVLQTSADEVVEKLAEQYAGDIAAISALTPYGVRLKRGLNVEELPLYRAGLVTVQDEGAMLVAPLLKPKEHLRILDMCAAPGTKSTHIAEMQGDKGRVVACDIHVHKLKLIRLAKERLSLSSIETKLADGRMLAEMEDMKETFDAVLLDAPCSGFGVLRHRPDIRYKRTEKDVRSLAKLQYELLTTAVQMVRKGGIIVYSTCTVLEEENEKLLDAFVRESNNVVEWDAIESDLPPSVRKYATDHGLTLTPDLFETDGFYMARLRKK
jgi:16S rRNA (cytosine967-C5)-methyltransferase